MPSNKDAGKAFEYALINRANEILSGEGFIISINEDATYTSALASYNIFDDAQKATYLNAASAAINHIIALEPKLRHSINDLDILTLGLMPDAAGQRGDVRDILFIRSRQNWEIGISAKNNHKAVKHSRLSVIKDFGEDWLGINCSNGYFDAIRPIFQRLQALKNENTLWRNVPNKHREIYMPVLNAFRAELLLINQNNDNIPPRLLAYLLGNNDFYKVIKKRRGVEVLGFNINNTLNLNIQGRPARNVPRLRLPTEIIRFEYKPGSTDTLFLVCDEGWQISFRIHNAESLVVPSLKFDINLIGHPETLYANHVAY